MSDDYVYNDAEDYEDNTDMNEDYDDIYSDNNFIDDDGDDRYCD